jgi:hypothetical protein
MSNLMGAVKKAEISKKKKKKLNFSVSLVEQR